jgi:2-polyprenyl-3-methyl-5-hydroxy-6-metoxy-1,4-benzoquinol methylase
MNWGKVRYFLRAALDLTHRDFSCPFCQRAQTHLVYRKAVVTSLWECDHCGLRFRVPKERGSTASNFYQMRYKAGFTTDCPSGQALAKLLESRFAGTEKDFGRYIEVLKALGFHAGDALLDFGCSWGYGSWQLSHAGFKVYSYEISQPRAAYAQTKLHCQVVANLEEVPEKVACFFSSHVIEHLADLNSFWQYALRVLAPGGKLVCVCPNGEPFLEQVYGSKTYHQLWGQPHPLLLTRKALQTMSRSYGFIPYVFSSPFSLEQIRDLHEPKQLLGSELLLVALRP